MFDDRSFPRTKMKKKKRPETGYKEIHVTVWSLVVGAVLSSGRDKGTHELSFWLKVSHLSGDRLNRAALLKFLFMFFFFLIIHTHNKKATPPPLCQLWCLIQVRWSYQIASGSFIISHSLNLGFMPAVYFRTKTELSTQSCHLQQQRSKIVLQWACLHQPNLRKKKRKKKKTPVFNCSAGGWICLSCCLVTDKTVPGGLNMAHKRQKQPHKNVCVSSF